ncbi:MAG: D-alanine--D-alanine ligase [Planctomycetes bacterium]|nr:D-alanine--D-alanine ligase [Planctomycetota bacterium]
MLDAVYKRVPPELRQERVAVVLGGPSPERDISIRSGQRVAEALGRLSLDCLLLEADAKLPAILKEHGVRLVFLATHGVPGEDGSLQGLLEGISVAYTGASVVGSALAIHKLASKRLLSAEGIPTPHGIAIADDVPVETLVHQLAADVYFPMIIKPVFGGSSIGVRLARNVPELRTCLELLLGQHGPLMAERYVPGRELTLSILEDSRGRPYPLPILELQPKNIFYDYECKVEKGKTDFIVPAELDEGTKIEAERLAMEAHRHLRMRDFSRSDFILDPEGALWYLETNSIPGLTDLSDLPAQAKAHGMTFEELVLTVLLGAWRRLRIA